MGEFSPWHLLIVAAVFVLLFGAKKLPDAARSIGKSARILKTELKDLHDDDDPAGTAAAHQTALPPVVVAPAPVVAPMAPAVPVVSEAPAQPVSTGSDQSPAS